MSFHLRFNPAARGTQTPQNLGGTQQQQQAGASASGSQFDITRPAGDTFQMSGLHAPGAADAAPPPTVSTRAMVADISKLPLAEAMARLAPQVAATLAGGQIPQF